MLLTKSQFGSIRTINWKLQSFADKTYYTAVNEIDTYLFWFDFMRNVFAPKFKSQQSVAFIAAFDMTQPVLLSPDFELKLPSLIESAIYYAENQKPSLPFSVPMSKKIIFALAELVLLVCLIWHIMHSVQCERLTQHTGRVLKHQLL